MIRPFFLLLLIAPASAQEPPKVDPVVAKAKGIQSFTPKFKNHVFTGNKFPALDAPLDFVRGITFYDRSYTKVDEASAAGPYLAAVEIKPEGGVSTKRYVTLYRLASPPAEKPDDPEGKLHITARVLAGKSLSDKNANPEKKYESPLAFERQWVLGLKRKLNGWDKQFPGPIAMPGKLKGDDATVVHEGKPEEAGVKPDTSEKLDAILTKWAADSDQAFAVCVVRKGVIVHHKAYGMRDGKPMTTETKSWMASVTKTMSAVMLMMLVDRGLVGLEDDVSKFFPSLKGIEVKKPLLVRNLLNHTGGLADFSMHDDSQNDVEERLASIYPHLKIGEKWAYGGTGNVLAGKIVEAVTGLAVPMAYQQFILEPLGMKNTDVAGTHADAYSVPLDMARYGQMLLNKGAYGQHLFFKPATFEMMLPRVLTIELGKDAKKTFGLGLDGQPKRFGHGAASAATFSVDVENELVVIMTRNKMGSNDGKYNGQFHEAIKAGILK